jgi:hypothetical protein
MRKGASRIANRAAATNAAARMYSGHGPMASSSVGLGGLARRYM